MSPRRLLGCLLLLCAGCESPDSLAPTPCDDHCHATQRADCRDDEPADCVRDCEREPGPHVGDVCLESFRALDACLQSAPPSAFFCANNHSQFDDICVPERRALSECIAPGSGTCFDQCVRRDHACGAPLSDCEDSCRHTSPDCAAVSSAYYTCLGDYPVDCQDRSGGDDRAPADIPCFYEALGLLACVE